MSRLSVFRQMAAQSKAALSVVIGASLGAAAANTAMLATLNHVIHDGENLQKWGLAFVGALVMKSLLTVGADRWLIRLAARLLIDIQTKTLKVVLNAPVRSLEKVGHQRIVTLLTDDLESIQDGFMLAPYVTTHAMVLLGGGLYLAWVYWPLLLGITLLAAFAILIQRLLLASNYKYLRHAYELADTLNDLFQGVTRGAKELKFSRIFRKRLSVEVQGAQHQLKDVIERSSLRESLAEATTQFSLYGVLGAVAFAAPYIFNVQREVLAQYVIAVLFLVAPLRALLSIQNQWIKSGAAVDRVQELRAKLASSQETLVDDRGTEKWSELRLVEACFEYEATADDEAFVVGPINLRVQPGELIFLVGGNGSGKTTLLKMLMGLYSPTRGEVTLDGAPLGGSQKCRELFGGVLSDFHLFGWIHADEQSHVDELMQRVALDKKVTINDGNFSSVNLSKGQRARLALVAALAERRSIYVFDEWAADQDPEFREFFYLQMLPTLKQSGVTVIAATHDDRYFGVADRVLRMDRGTLYDWSSRAASDAPRTGELRQSLERESQGTGHV